MTDAAQETPKKTRNRRPKGQSMPVMKELIGLMDQRTVIMEQIRQKKMELGVKQMEISTLESDLQTLGTEIKWRANIFGMETKPEVEVTQQPPQWNFPAPPQLTQPIFAHPPQPPEPARTFNRGSANADLANLS